MPDNTDYSKAISGENSNTQASSNLDATNGVSPEAAVSAYRSGPQVGIPPELAMHNPDQAQELARSQNDRAILNSNSDVRQWVASNPVRAAASQDDLGGLANISDKINSFLAAPWQAWWSQGAALVKQHEAQQAAEKPKPVGEQALDIFGPSEVQGLSQLKDWAEFGISGLSKITSTPGADALNYAADQAFRKAVGEENYRKIMDVVGKGLMGLAPDIRAGLPALAAPDLAAMTSEPLDIVRGPEGAPLKFDSAREAAVYGRNNPPEGQAYYEVHARNDGFVLRTVDASAQAPPPPGVNPVADEYHTAVAEADAAQVAQAQQAVSESKLFQRSPEMAKDYLSEIGVGQKIAYVDPVVLRDLYVTGEKPFPTRVDDIEQAMFMHHDVAIPMDEYLAQTAGQPWADKLREATRFSDRGVSQTEAKELTPEEGEEQEAEAKPPAAPVILPDDIPAEMKPTAQSIAAKVEDSTEQVFQQQFLKQLFDTPAAAGMTKSQFDRYNSRIEEARANIRDKMLNKLYNQVRRERKPEWQAAVDLRMEEAQVEVNQRPAIAAYRNLRDPDFKLDRDAIEKNYPELAKDVPSTLMKRSGADPDEIAELTGHTSGADLVQDLAFLKRAMDAVGAKNIDQFTKGLARDLATGRARQDVGYDMSEQSILDAVSELMTEPDITDFLIDELRALAKQSGLSFNKEQVKNQALTLFSNLEVGDAMKIREFERGMKKMGDEAERALLKEKYKEAFLAKEKQLLNHYMLAESHKLLKAYAGFDRRATRLAGRATFQGIDQEYLNYIHQALFDLGYAARRNRIELADQLAGQSLESFVEGKIGAGRDLAVGPIPKVESVKKLTVAEFAMVKDSIESLEHNGRLEQSLWTLLGNLVFNEAVETAIAQLNKIGEHFTFDQLREILNRNLVVGNLEQNIDIGHNLRLLDGAMVKPEQLLDWFDRNERGIFNEVVTEPLQQAKHDQDDLEASFAKKMVDFRKAQPKGWSKSLKLKIDVPELGFTRDGAPERVVASKKDILAIALNWGNDSNVDKLLRGYNWQYSNVEKALADHMTLDDWKFVEHIWSLFAELWPKAEAMYRRMSGVAPPKIQPRTFTHKFGESLGGYYPVQFDPFLAPRVGGSKGDMFDPRYARAIPPNPYANARSPTAYPIELNLDLVGYRLGQVIHDITHREALVNAEKFLLNPKIKQKLTFVFGPEYTTQLRPFLEYVANAKVFDDKALSWFANAIKTMRMNITMVALGYRASTIVKHGSSALANSITEVGVKSFAAASSRFAMDPSGVTKLVMEKSGEVRNRLSNIDREMREAYRSLYLKQGFISTVQHYAFHGVGAIDLASAIPTWLAVYNEEIAKGSEEQVAVQTADKRVRQAHGASGSADLAAIQRSEDTAGGQLWKLMTSFISYMNHVYNRQRTNIRLVTDASNRRAEGDNAGARRDFNKGLGKFMSYLITMGVIEETFRHLAQGDDDDFMTSVVKGLTWDVTSGVPILRDAVDAITHGKDYEQSPLGRALNTEKGSLNDVIHALKGEPDKVSHRWLQRSLETIGYFLGLPTGQLGETTQNIWDYSTGRETPDNFLDGVRGALFGPKQHHKE